MRFPHAFGIIFIHYQALHDESKSYLLSFRMVFLSVFSRWYAFSLSSSPNTWQSQWQRLRETHLNA